MKLYVINRNRQRIYLSITAGTRTQLANIIGSELFNLNGEVYSVWDVIAEKDSNSTAAGAVLGGLVGLIGGPIGLISGATAGALIGNSSDSKEGNKVERFNNS